MGVNENAEGTKSLRHFRPWGGLCARTRKKKPYFTAFSPMGGAFMPTQEKKKPYFLMKLRNFKETV